MKDVISENMRDKHLKNLKEESGPFWSVTYIQDIPLVKANPGEKQGLRVFEEDK